MKTQSLSQATLRFYAELNDRLSLNKRQKFFSYYFLDHPNIKIVLKSLGISHKEVDLILVNGVTQTLNYRLNNQDIVSIYPVFETLDISAITRVREKPLRNSKFILDVHLGTLAKYLRMLGFDSLFENNYNDKQIIDIAKKQKRIILSRDKALLKSSSVTHGYFVYATNPKEQIIEIINRLDLFKQAKPLTRCLICNRKITTVKKETILKKLPLATERYFDDFFECHHCKKIFWRGSHYQRMKSFVNEILTEK